MIVFTNTRNEEAVSLSLNNFQLSAQTYNNSPAFIQLYNNYGPRDVVVSIGACGALWLGSNPDEGPLTFGEKND